MKPIFRWAAEHEEHYAAQSSAAGSVAGTPAAGGGTFSEDSVRGLFGLLTGEHVPFAVSDNLDWIGSASSTWSSTATVRRPGPWPTSTAAASC